MALKQKISDEELEEHEAHTKAESMLRECFHTASVSGVLITANEDTNLISVVTLGNSNAEAFTVLLHAVQVLHEQEMNKKLFGVNAKLQ